MDNCSSSRVSQEVECQLYSVLKAIYPKEVTLEKIASRRKKILNLLLKDFCSVCQNLSIPFRLLFMQFYYTGSAFEGLQVKEAVEFDINVVLKFPFNSDEFLLQEFDHPSSFATFQLQKPLEVLLQHYPEYQGVSEFIHFFDGSGFLIGKRVLSWMQSLVDKFIITGSFKTLQWVKKIKKTNSGPACTLKVQLDDVWISVDLVPVIVLCNYHKLSKMVPLDHLIPNELMGNFYLVPKPLTDNENYQLAAEDSQRLWRLHFPEAENKLLKERSCLKPVIKLVKSFRDKQNWKLPSYFIKTVAFWIISKHPNPKYYAEEALGIRFLEMLESLYNHLSAGHLGHIFYPKFNHLGRLGTKSLVPMKNRLKKVIPQIYQTPSSLKKLFKCSKYPKPKSLKKQLFKL